MAIKAAVLTADIVDSTKLEAAVEKKMLKELQVVLAPYQFEFYRGDSFQVFVQEPANALRIALLCRTVAIGFSNPEKAILSDVRISIGIGDVETTVKLLGAAKGEAFVLSGRTFDKIAKTETRLSISVNNALAGLALEVIADYVNAIYNGMTAKQAKVIFTLLKGQTQQEVAAILKKSKSTIHQHVTSGRWGEIEKLLQQYENIIKL